MRATLNTRKPVHKLLIRDFRSFPIWEYAIDEENEPGRDETWVRPVRSKFVPKGVYSQLVSARFTTASGKRLNGFMTVNTAGGRVEVLSGVVLGQLRFRPIPMVSRALAVKRRQKWAIQTRDELVAAIGQSEPTVLPLKYSLLVLIHGEKSYRQGRIM
jgi:hypothetical protein